MDTYRELVLYLIQDRARSEDQIALRSQKALLLVEESHRAVECADLGVCTPHVAVDLLMGGGWGHSGDGSGRSGDGSGRSDGDWAQFGGGLDHSTDARLQMGGDSAR